MSEQFAEAAAQAQEPEAVELPPQSDAAFGALMDALAPEESSEETGAGDETSATDAAATGPATPPAEGTESEAGDAGAPAGGDDGQPEVQGEGSDRPDPAAAGSGDGSRPETWTAAATDLIPKLGELSTAIEESTTKAYQQQALSEVREEHAKYFEALEKHPRLLVGQAVPRIGGEGEETLRDTADAREWQEAVKTILVDEVKARAVKSLEDNREFLDTIHASIEIFQNNADLVPGTKDFDVELANKFAALMKPYELRVDEKLQGYSIPVQPIINQLRADITASRKAAPPAAAAPAPAKKAAAPADPPQAGIQSKAGNSSETDDFSALFGTLGLPNLRI